MSHALCGVHMYLQLTQNADLTRYPAAHPLPALTGQVPSLSRAVPRDWSASAKPLLGQ